MTINISAEDNQPEWIREADDGDEDETEEKSWIPYEGPQGGTGWKDTNTGRVEYGEEPPGKTVDPDNLSDEDLETFAENHGIDASPEEIRDKIREEIGGGDGESDVSDSDVESKVNEVMDDFMENAEPRPDSPEDINLGLCNAFANSVFEGLGEPEGMEILESYTMGARHQWVSYNGKHYDAEVPEGVDDFKDLPIWDRFGRPDEPDVIKEGGSGDNEPETEEIAGKPMTEGEFVTVSIEGSGETSGTVEFVDVGGNVWITIENEDGKLNHYSGSDVEDWRPGEDQNAAEKLWVPYEGPRGGEGWKNLKTDRVEYAKNPPGPAAKSPEEIREALESRGASGVGGVGKQRKGSASVSIAEDAYVYSIGGNPAPPIVAEPGEEIVFDVDTPGEPFYIATEPGGGGYRSAYESNVEVDNPDSDMSTEAGRLILTVPSGHDRLYYCSTSSVGMGGLIFIDEGGGTGLAQKADDRVYISSRHEAPRSVVVHHDEERGLYYVPESGADEGDVSDADEADEKAQTSASEKASWVPHTGPRGGEGWQNVDDGRIVYQDNPPGSVLSPDDISDEQIEAIADNIPGIEPEDVRRELGDLSDRQSVSGLSDGDVVAAEVDGQHIEGEVVFYDGDFVDINMDDRVIEAEIEDVTEIIEEGDGVVPWTGEEHPENVEDTMTADDVREGLYRSITKDQGEEQAERAINALNDTLGPNDEWPGPHDGVSDAVAYITGARPTSSTVTSIAKDITRGRRYSNNSASDHLDPSRAEDVVDLSESGLNGVTAAAMDVCEMPDGSKLFVTHVDEGVPGQTFHQATASTKDAEAAVGAAAAMEAMGIEAPDHHYEHNRFLAVEEVEGTQVMDLQDGPFTPEPDMDQVTEAMAAQILIGNRDAHQGNVIMKREREPDPPDEQTINNEVERILGENNTEFPGDDRLSPAFLFEMNPDTDEFLFEMGYTMHNEDPPDELVETIDQWYEDAAGGKSKAVCFDLDLAGHDATNWESSTAVDKAAGTLNRIEDPSRGMTPDYIREELMNHVADLARRTDIDEVTEAIPDRSMRETVRNNIEAWRDKR